MEGGQINFNGESVRSGSRALPNYVGGGPLLRDGTKVEYESSVKSGNNADQNSQLLV